MDVVRWGVLSTADIGRSKVIPAIQAEQRSVVTAIASRNPETAERVATELGIERAYGSYEHLLAEPDIDAVYIPLPNHLHAEWTIAAARAAGSDLIIDFLERSAVFDVWRELGPPAGCRAVNETFSCAPE